MFNHCEFHFHFGSAEVDSNITQQLENLMSKVQEAINQAMAQQDLVVSAANTITHLAQGVKDLLAVNDVRGAQELLDKIQVNNTTLANAIVIGTEAGHLANPAVDLVEQPVEQPVEQAVDQSGEVNLDSSAVDTGVTETTDTTGTDSSANG